MAKRDLGFKDWKSQKFWSIELKGTSHTVTFGRIGTNGQTKTKDFATEEKAKKSYDKLVEQKLGKGYVDAKKGSSPETDRDRLNSAFAAISQRGIIAMQNAGYTQSDGYEDFQDAYESHRNPASALGYCFYHGQDVESAKKGKGLFLAFGPVDPKDEKKNGPKVGNIVREELERVGLDVEWDGTFGTRLHLPDFVWESSRKKPTKKKGKTAKAAKTKAKKTTKKVTAKKAKKSAKKPSLKASQKRAAKKKVVKAKKTARRSNRKK